jgi:hypothetical protein
MRPAAAPERAGACPHRAHRRPVGTAALGAAGRGERNGLQDSRQRHKETKRRELSHHAEGEKNTIGWEHVGKPPVPWIGANAVPRGFVWVLVTPVCVSVTVVTTRTFVRPPAKPQPFNTLTIISTLSRLKNQK